jgi:hypothetical protein
VDQRAAVVLVPAVAALGRPGVEAVPQYVSVALVGALDELELDLLPALAQGPARPRVVVAVAPGEVVEEGAEAAFPVYEGAVAVECGGGDAGVCDLSALLHLSHLGSGTRAG